MQSSHFCISAPPPPLQSPAPPSPPSSLFLLQLGCRKRSRYLISHLSWRADVIIDNLHTRTRPLSISARVLARSHAHACMYTVLVWSVEATAFLRLLVYYISICTRYWYGVFRLPHFHVY